VLPRKRITAAAEIDGRRVLAKLFIAKQGSRRHWEREQQGILALLREGIPTPGLLTAGRLAGGGYYLLSEFIDGAQTIGWHYAIATDSASLLPACATLGLMHHHGLIHADPHMNNFLVAGGRVYVIDGDGIRDAVPVARQRHNLALLFAQLPPLDDASFHPLLQAYLAGNPTAQPDKARLADEIEQCRQRGLAAFLDKCTRDCTLFKVKRNMQRFVAVVREEAERLAPVLADPDAWLSGAVLLKQGRTATLGRITLDDHSTLVIKRYNIKDPLHALSRCWRPSRAWHSWVEAHRLRFLGIETPRPLALIEERRGPLRGRAWLVTDDCPGENLLELFASGSPSDEALRAIDQAFGRLVRARISHGDMKATNLLWHRGRISLIDLDAMRQHGRQAGFRKAWGKDRARFLRNWADRPAVRDALATVVPEV
jgi:tRNA A-37 threonylcarbamoyl transferase component Bud32